MRGRLVERHTGSRARAAAHRRRGRAGSPPGRRAVPAVGRPAGRPVATGGWDNWTFHLGDEMSVRLPTAAEYAVAVEKEHRGCRCSPALPLPVPVPLAQGAPGAAIPTLGRSTRGSTGETAAPAGIADPVAFAVDLAEFLAALQGVDADRRPAAGPAQLVPGRHPATYDAATQRRPRGLERPTSTRAAARVWAARSTRRGTARRSGSTATSRRGNLLVRRRAAARRHRLRHLRRRRPGLRPGDRLDDADRATAARRSASGSRSTTRPGRAAAAGRCGRRSPPRWKATRTRTSRRTSLRAMRVVDEILSDWSRAAPR